MVNKFVNVSNNLCMFQESENWKPEKRNKTRYKMMFQGNLHQIFKSLSL